MDKNEIIERLERLARCAIHTVGELPFVMSLDDGIAIHEAIDMLRSQPEPHWIPATIPPKVSDKYLVTHGGSYILSLDTYTTMEDAVRIFDEGYDDYIGWQSQNVIAWMPLPEPYKGGKDV